MAIHLASVVSKRQTLSTSDHASVVSMNLFVALLRACIVIGHLLEENRRMNESSTALLIDLGTGVVSLLVSGGKSSHLLVFREDLFFRYLLPPIIFNAGFQVKKRKFFHNFVTIMLFGAVGTLISCTIISLGIIQFFKQMDNGSLDIGDFLAIGVIFAATDSVCTLQDETPLLYSLVFGEGVVNDATSVVLFNAIQSFDLTNSNHRIALQFIGNFIYLFFTSTMLGVVAGLLSAYIIKTLYFGSHALATLSFVSEIFIFLYVGTDALDIEKWRFVSDSPGTSVAVSIVLLALVLAGRAAFVFPLSFISNLAKKSPNDRINFRQQFTTLGQTQLQGNATMITSTITVVLFSAVVFGLMTKALIRFLLPNSKQTSMISDPSSPKSITLPFIGSRQDSFADDLHRPSSIRELLRTSTHTVCYSWRKFDNAFMRPVFGGRGFVPFVPGSRTEKSEYQNPRQ